MGKRHKDGNWTIRDPVQMDGAQLAVLMDIRDELKELRSNVAQVRQLLQCPRIPKALVAIDEVGRDIRRRQKAKRERARKRSAE